MKDDCVVFEPLDYTSDLTVEVCGVAKGICVRNMGEAIVRIYLMSKINHILVPTYVFACPPL